MHRHLGLALLLAGCSFGGEPVVTNFDGSMVTIVQPKSAGQKAASAVASETCGRRATQLSKLCNDTRCNEEKLVYWCR